LAKAATVASLHGAPLGRNHLSATVITTAPVSELAAGAANSAMSLRGPKTSIGNNVQRAGNNSPPRSRRRIGLELGLVRGTARTFFARFQSPSARGGRHSEGRLLARTRSADPHRQGRVIEVKQT
jgi:hypothetical protein